MADNHAVPCITCLGCQAMAGAGAKSKPAGASVKPAFPAAPEPISSGSRTSQPESARAEPEHHYADVQAVLER